MSDEYNDGVRDGLDSAEKHVELLQRALAAEQGNAAGWEFHAREARADMHAAEEACDWWQLQCEQAERERDEARRALAEAVRDFHGKSVLFSSAALRIAAEAERLFPKEADDGKA